MYYFTELNIKLKELKHYFESNNIPNSNIIIKEVSKRNILSNYPDFYKFLLEELGTLYISYCDQFILEICLPKPTKEFWFLDEEEWDELGLEIIFHTDDHELDYLIIDRFGFYSNKSNLSHFTPSEFSDYLIKKLDNLIS